MNLCIFFEGTGQGVSGRATNATRMRDLCVEDPMRQRLQLEPGPGTHFGTYLSGLAAGAGWRGIFGDARRWFEANAKPPRPDAAPVQTFVFGFSRGALIARHFAAWLDRLSVPVAYLGLWDTVDSTAGLDVPETCPANVAFARHAVARDEPRRLFGLVPLKAGEGRKGSVEELLFPGSHSDVGGLYEDGHQIADLSLAWIAHGAVRQGILLKEDADIEERLDDPESVTLHDPHGDATNFWGAPGRAKRDVSGIPLHPLCDRVRRT